MIMLLMELVKEELAYLFIINGIFLSKNLVFFKIIERFGLN